METQRRWTEIEIAIGVHSRRYRECDSCGGADAVVISGFERGGTVDRRLRCDCGRRWRQVIVK